MAEDTENLDPVQQFAASFNDPAQWKVVRGVPVFDEHDEEMSVNVPGPDGKLHPQKRVERFSARELQQHCDNTNRMVESGNPPGLTIGHTLDNAPESQQPETVGFSRNYRVAFHPTLKKNVVLHDEYYFPKRYEEAKSYPWRSVERWRKGQYFRPVALLRREPRRNLGPVILNQADGSQILRYQAEPRDIIENGQLIDSVTRYAMEAPAMPDMNVQPTNPPAAMPPAAPPVQNAAPAQPAAAAQPPAPAQPAQPAAPAAPMQPSAQDTELFAKLMSQYMADPSRCKAMYAAMQAGNAPPPAAAGAPPAPPAEPQPAPAGPAAPEQNAMSGAQAKAMWAQVDDAGEGKRSKKTGEYDDMDGEWHTRMQAGGAGAMPSGSNTAIPSLVKDKKPEKDTEKMSANAEIERYQQRVEELEAARNRDSLRIAELEKGERVARYSQQLDRLANHDGYPIDVPEEIERCQDYTDAEFQQHVKDIRKYGAANQRPLGGPVKLADAPGPRFSGEPGRMNKDQYESAMQYMRENPGKDWPSAMKYAMSETPVR